MRSARGARANALAWLAAGVVLLFGCGAPAAGASTEPPATPGAPATVPAAPLPPTGDPATPADPSSPAADPADPVEPPAPVDPPPPPAPRALFFGSSSTTGFGTSSPSRRWTSLLASRFGWTEVNRGLNGSKLTERGDLVRSAEARWRDDVALAAPDLVFVMYGANDIDWRVPLGAVDQPNTFEHAVRAVLTGIRVALPQARIVVLEPQPAQALATARIPYDAALAAGAAEIGAPLVRAGTAFPAGTYAADVMHLTDDGHAALAAFVEAALLEAGVAP